jgi:hypothetical protein
MAERIAICVVTADALHLGYGDNQSLVCFAVGHNGIGLTQSGDALLTTLRQAHAVLHSEPTHYLHLPQIGPTHWLLSPLAPDHYEVVKANSRDNMWCLLWHDYDDTTQYSGKPHFEDEVALYLHRKALGHD